MSGQWAHGLRKRVAYGLLSNVFGKVVVAISQLIGVPIFLHFWGKEMYGEWLLLNALPTYLGLSDMGFGSAAGNEMTILESQGKRGEVIETFQSIWVLITLASGIAGLLSFLIIPLIPLQHWLHLTQLTPKATTWISLLLVGALVLGMQEQLFQSAFRCVGQYAYGTFVKAVIEFASFTGVAVAVVFGATPVQAAIAYAAINVCGTIAIWLLLRRSIPWVHLGWRHARWPVIRKLASPAFSFLGFPIGNAIGIQGILFVINATLGAVGVVLFGVTRTASRLAFQLLQTVNNTVWPELSAAFGAGDISLTRRLHRRACQAAFAVSWFMVLVMIAAGPWLIRLWTHNKVSPTRGLIGLLLLAIVFNSFWKTSSTLLVAINRHQKLAGLYLIGTSASLVLAIYLTRLWGVNGAAVSLLVSEMVLMFYVLPVTLALVEDTPRAFARAMFQPIKGLSFQQIMRSLGYGSTPVEGAGEKSSPDRDHEIV